MVTIHLLVVDVSRNESRLIEVSIDHAGAYPIEPAEQVDSEHDTREEAETAQDNWNSRGDTKERPARKRHQRP